MTEVVLVLVVVIPAYYREQLLVMLITLLFRLFGFCSTSNTRIRITNSGKTTTSSSTGTSFFFRGCEG